MPKITYAPAEELVIHEIIEMGRDDLLRERVTPQGTMPLYWVNGFLFSFTSLPMTDDVVKDYLKGKLHWIELHFTKMDKYVPILSLDEEEFKQRMNIRVIDTSFSKIHQELAKWLHNYNKK